MNSDISNVPLTKLSGGRLCASYHSGWTNSSSANNGKVDTSVSKPVKTESYVFNKSGKENLPEIPQTTLGTAMANAGISIGIGLGQSLEPTIDYSIQATSEIVWGANKIMGLVFSLLGYEGGIAATQQVESFIENDLTEFIATNWTETWTNQAIDASGTRTAATNGIVTGARKIEDFVGSLMLLKLPGPWSMIATAVTSSGKTAEKGYSEGWSYAKTAVLSHIEGILAFCKVGLLKNLNSGLQIFSGDGASSVLEGGLSELPSNINFGQLATQVFNSTSATVVNNITRSVAEWFTDIFVAPVEAVDYIN